MAKVRKTLTTNQELFNVIRDLKQLSSKTGVGVYKAVAGKLSTSASQKVEVNLSKIERFAKDKETLIVPGKVLGTGILTKKVTIVSFKVSDSALKKIEAAGSKFISMEEFIAKPNPKVRIIG